MSGARRFRKKPVEVYAHRFDGTNTRAVADWCGGSVVSDQRIDIRTLEGTMTATLGDYVIQGVQGEFYPCKPDIFEATYEAVE